MFQTLTGLIGGMEVVEERVASGDWALIHERRSVRPVRTVLEHTMPMLTSCNSQRRVTEGDRQRCHTIEVDLSIVAFVN